MADKKVSQLNEITEAEADDLLYLVNGPLRTSTSRKITINNLKKSIRIMIVIALPETAEEGEVVYLNTDKHLYLNIIGG